MVTVQHTSSVSEPPLPSNSPASVLKSKSIHVGWLKSTAADSTAARVQVGGGQLLQVRRTVTVQGSSAREPPANTVVVGDCVGGIIHKIYPKPVEFAIGLVKAAFPTHQVVVNELSSDCTVSSNTSYSRTDIALVLGSRYNDILKVPLLQAPADARIRWDWDGPPDDGYGEHPSAGLLTQLPQNTNCPTHTRSSICHCAERRGQNYEVGRAV